MFWDNFYSLCHENKKSPNAIAKELGISSGAITSWKKGKVPHHNTLLKIAQYFGVTVDYLLGNTDQRGDKEKTPSKLWEGEEMSDKEKQLWDLWHRVPDEQKPHILALIQSALALKAEEYKNGGQKG